MFEKFDWTEISAPRQSRFSEGYIVKSEGQKYFLKCPLENQASQMQFSAETYFYQNLSSFPEILPQLALVPFNGMVAQVFPFIEKDLVDLVGKLSPQSIEETLLRPLFAAAKHIHNSGFVHGDLKLENIRVEESDRKFSIFVSDFGKSIPWKDFTPNRLGSLSQHIPPDFTVGPQFDIYSIGVILFQVLFGFDFIKTFQMTGRSFRLLPEAQHVEPRILDFIFRATEPSALKRFKSIEHAEAFLSGDSSQQRYEVSPYNLGLYFEFYLECLRETFVESNRSNRNFEEFIGPWGEKYYQRLQVWTKSENAHLVHLKKGRDLCGLCEASLKQEGVGMISTIFVASTERGRGGSGLLEESAMGFFESRHQKLALLNVTEGNARAIAFYRKRGWRESLERQYPDAIQMQKDVNP